MFVSTLYNRAKQGRTGRVLSGIMAMGLVLLLTISAFVGVLADPVSADPGSTFDLCVQRKSTK